MKLLRIVRYKVLPPVNPFGDPIPHQHGSLAEFLFAIPGLLEWGIVPPLSVINDVLLIGKADIGMGGGCEWKSFQLEREEYDDLVMELVTLPGKTFYITEPPEQVKTYEDWSRWTLDQRLF